MDDVVERLRTAGCVFAEDEAAVLREAAADPAELETLVARRVAGEPLETVVGWVEFAGRRWIVEPGVFIPRARTVVLVEAALELVDDGDVLVDLCAGVGAIGGAVAAARPGVVVHAAELDPVAVDCARRNLTPFGAHAWAGDLFDALPAGLRGTVDVVVANAPYVPTDAIATMPPEARDHEPHVALDGGPDGRDVARRILAAAPTWLRPGGHLLVETGEVLADGLADLFESAGLLDVTVLHDNDHDGTAVAGRTHAQISD
ncbi:putative protein N(5)-glutamine methyltransferase [Jatrophihabitans sp. YIM 134969]